MINPASSIISEKDNPECSQLKAIAKHPSSKISFFSADNEHLFPSRINDFVRIPSFQRFTFPTRHFQVQDPVCAKEACNSVTGKSGSRQKTSIVAPVCFEKINLALMTFVLLNTRIQLSGNSSPIFPKTEVVILPFFHMSSF